MYNILGTSVPQDKANTHHHARFLPVSNSFDRVCLRCNLTLFTRRIKSCTSMRYLYPHFRKEIFIDAKCVEFLFESKFWTTMRRRIRNFVFFFFLCVKEYFNLKRLNEKYLSCLFIFLRIKKKIKNISIWNTIKIPIRKNRWSRNEYLLSSKPDNTNLKFREYFKDII